MTRSEIQSFFPAWTNVFFYDETYARPKNDWVFNQFYPWLRSRHSTKWTRKHDCDNIARRFCVECQDAHADSNHTDEALAVGEFCYVGTTHVKGPHAIVVAFTEDPVPVFIEPQTGQRLALTPTEILSCFRVTF